MVERRQPASADGGQRWLAVQPLVLLLLATASGIAVDRVASCGLGWWLCTSLAALAAWYAVWRRGYLFPAALLLLIAAASVGGGWHHVRWNLFPADELGLAAGDSSRPVCLDAVALGLPRVLPAAPPNPMNPIPSGERSLLSVRVTAVRDGQRWRPASGRATLLTDGRLAGFTAGDRVRLFAQLRKPPGPQNPGQRDLRRVRRAQRELFELRSQFPEAVVLIQRGRWWSPRRGLYAARGACCQRLETYLGDRQAELASAVLLGARAELSEDRVEEFFLTGTVHLLAISGLHLGILASGLWWLLRISAAERRTAVAAAAVFVVLYALLVEARPPVVQAAVLVVVFCAARLSARRGSNYNTLAAAALLLLAFKPTLLFQVGPQLSFLAVATIAAAAPLVMPRRQDDPLQRLIARSHSWPRRAAGRLASSVGSVCIVGTLIWLVTMPLVLCHFNVVCPIALVLNPVIWMPMTLALFSGFGVLVLGWVLPPAAAVCGWICSVSLATLEAMVHWASQVPGGHLWLPAPAGWWTAGLYGLLGVLLAIPRARLPMRWRVVLLIAWIAAGCWFADPRARRAPQLVCTFVSVGHGACTIVELPDRRTLLSDAGGMGLPASVVRSISGCLWSRGITHLDAVVLSHADADHYNALPELLERFTVGVVYVSPMMFDEASEPLRALREAILQAGPEIRLLHAGQRLAAGPDTRIEIWHPPPRGVIGSDNANSIVVAIEHRGSAVLLPGDLESPGLEDVLAEEPRHWDVVSAPHHGSGIEQQQAFAAWALPDWAVISGASWARSRPAEQVYRARRARVLHTDREGAVRAVLGERGAVVSCWQEGWQPAADRGPRREGRLARAPAAEP